MPGARSILAIANSVHKEMEALQPDVPLLMALRTRGVTKRHWAEIRTCVAKVAPPEKRGQAERIELEGQHMCARRPATPSCFRQLQAEGRSSRWPSAKVASEPWCGSAP